MPKRIYSESEKASILANLDANDGNVSKTARESEIPRCTLDSWKHGIGINDDIRNIQHVKKEELRDLHKFIAVKALGLLGKKLQECSGQQLSTIAAISTEKMLLLSGEATQIRQELGEEQQVERVVEILEKGKLRLVKQDEQEVV